MVDYVLSDDKYIGNVIYNRESRPLREQKIKNAPEAWVKRDGVIAPAVSEDIFSQARKRLTLRWERLDDEQLLSRLRALFEREGRLSQELMNRTLGIPSINVYIDRFGSVRNAYRLIGYETKWNFDRIDRKSDFGRILGETADQLIDLFRKAGSSARFQPGVDQLIIEDSITVSLRLARSWQGSGRKAIWTIYRREVLQPGFITAIRLATGNRDVLDYMLLPTAEMTEPKIRFTASRLSRFEGKFFDTLAPLAKSILRQRDDHSLQHRIMSRSGNASQAMRHRTKPPRTTRRPRGQSEHE